MNHRDCENYSDLCMALAVGLDDIGTWCPRAVFSCDLCNDDCALDDSEYYSEGELLDICMSNRWTLASLSDSASALSQLSENHATCVGQLTHEEASCDL